MALSFVCGPFRFILVSVDGAMTKNDLKNMYSVDENRFYSFLWVQHVFFFFFLQFIGIASSGTVVMFRISTPLDITQIKRTLSIL